MLLDGLLHVQTFLDLALDVLVLFALFPSSSGGFPLALALMLLLLVVRLVGFVALYRKHPRFYRACILALLVNTVVVSIMLWLFASGDVGKASDLLIVYALGKGGGGRALLRGQEGFVPRGMRAPHALSCPLLPPPSLPCTCTCTQPRSTWPSLSPRGRLALSCKNTWPPCSASVRAACRGVGAGRRREHVSMAPSCHSPSHPPPPPPPPLAPPPCSRVLLSAEDQDAQARKYASETNHLLLSLAIDEGMGATSRTNTIVHPVITA
jgi:hypothetical protein